MAACLVLAATSTSARAEKKTDPVVGTYDWFNGHVITIRDNGTVTARGKDVTVAGRWVANPYGGYVIMWQPGHIDNLKMTASSRKLVGWGLNGEGKTIAVTGTRRK
jgi:hypothetical protein